MSHLFYKYFIFLQPENKGLYVFHIYVEENNN